MDVIPMKVLVTGCGRSGTHFMTSVMQAHGVQVNHECFGPDGLVHWRFAAPQKLATFENVFHVHRHPLDSINSIRTILPVSWQFIEEHAPRTRGATDPMLKAAIYWLEWNRMSENIASFSFSVENIGHAGEELFGHLGIEFKPHTVTSAVKGSRARRATYGRLRELAQLAAIDEQIYHEVCQLAERYGYAVGPDTANRSARLSTGSADPASFPSPAYHHCRSGSKRN